MAFNQKIANLLAYRSAYICNNPDCNTLTVGAELNDDSLKLKIGEAAHIIGEKPKAARYESISIDLLSAIDNGIWLCANCHTMIDKNSGIGFSKDTIKSWKKNHEEMIYLLIKTHKSPVPLLLKQTENFKVAQELVDYLSGKGVFYFEASYENPEHVFISLTEIRKEVDMLARKINLDKNLKKIFTEIKSSAQVVMNETSVIGDNFDYQLLGSQLEVMRRKAGRQLGLLKNKYGCNVSGQLESIVF